MALEEKLILGGLSLNTLAGNFSLEAVDFTPPPKKPEWAQAADADGANLVRTPLFDNRTITASVRIAPQASMNLALEKLGEIVDQLQEAEKNPGGIPLEWTPANSTKTITFYVLTGAVTGIPVVNEGNTAGYFAAAPLITISMTCKPFGYGAEVEAAAAKSIETGLSVVTLTIGKEAVAGDVPAEGRLVVKDTAAVGRRFVEWGLENRYYDATTKLILDSEDMTPVGGAQTTEYAANAYKRAGATKTTISTALVPQSTICCNTGNLKHVGTFRVKARVLLAGSYEGNAIALRLAWQDGSGPLRTNSWASPSAGGVFTEVDLGVITINPAILGTQKWFGQIEGLTLDGNVAGRALHIDYLCFVPALEGYGKARGEASPAANIVAYDNFTTGVLSGTLNGRTPPIGTAWATSGAATDFAVKTEATTRATISDAGPRYAVFGGALTNTQVSAQFVDPAGFGGTPLAVGFEHGVIARWASATNYAALVLHYEETTPINIDVSVRLVTVVAGVTTILRAVRFAYGTALGAALTVLSDGSMRALVGEGGRTTTLGASSKALATGEALASGKAGFYDFNPSTKAGTRSLTRLEAGDMGAVVPYCIQPSRSMEVRSESAITADSTGTYYGPVPQYRGSRFFVPQSGVEKRTSRILVKADRNDLEESDQQTIADAFTAQVFATPRFHVIPR